MSAAVEYFLNKASKFEIVEHLRLSDAHFVPPLSNRVEIDDYAEKIARKAVRFEAWTRDQLIGLVATYCADGVRRVAYITSVSVRSEWTGRGIAAKLMEQCIIYLKDAQFDRVELEVNNANTRAIRLYEERGFIKNDNRDDSQILVLHLNRKKVD